MKKTRYILIALALIIAAVTIAVLTSVTQIATMEADGYAVSGSVNLKQALTKGEDVTQNMEKVRQDDIIYASALGYYVGTNRTPIDRNFPVYMNEGQTLRFLDDDKWLVATDLKLLQTYNGLYLNDGFTYNRDLSQADGEEFLLLALNNGLYINAQKAVFTNTTAEREIPLNSICYFTESYLRWYYYDNGRLFYDQEDSVGGATLSIGSHKYSYDAFLEALDLIQEKIDHPKEVSEIEETMPETLEPYPVETINAKQEPETSEGITGGGDYTLPTEAKLEEEEVFYLGEVGGDDDRPKKTGLSESGNGEGQAKDIPSGNRNASRQDADDIADSDREKAEAGGDIPDTDRHASSGRTTPGGSSSGGSKPAWKAPEISLSDFKTWMYAVDAKLNYSDPASTMNSSVIVSVYSKITLDATEPVETKTDAQGNTVYPYAADLTAYSASELDLLGKTSLIGSQEFAISPLEPGSTVYVQYSYEYLRQGSKTAIKVVSDFTEIKLDAFDADKLVPVLATWSVKEAEYARKFAFHDLLLQNEPQGDPEEEEEETEFDFEEFKKDSLPYINHMTVELYNETKQTPVHMPMNDTYVKVAKKKATEYNSRAELTPGCVYTYQIYGTDNYGNVFPLKIQTEDMPVSESYLTFKGTLYTRQEAPAVSVRFDDITKNTAKISTVVLDEEDVLVAGEGLTVCLKDKDGNTVNMTGSYKKVIDEKKGQYGPAVSFTNEETVVFPLTAGEVQNTHYVLELTGLSTFTNYIMKVVGTYNPNLTVAGHQTSLSLVEETLVSQSFWTARDSKDYDLPTAIFESVEAVSSTSIKGNLWLIDDKGVMPSGAVITVYDGVRAAEKTSSEEVRGTAVVSGKSGTEKTYDKKDYSGIHILNRQSVTGDGEVTLKDLVPGSKAYVQLSFNVIYLENGHQKNATVQSDFLEIEVPYEEYSLNTITVSWEEGFATGEHSISLNGISFEEARSVQAPVSALDKLLDHLVLTLTPAATAGDPVEITLGTDVIDRAKRNRIDYDSGNIKDLKTDTMYVYSVRAYRSDGTELPLKVSVAGRGTVDAGENAGYLYTCKQKPEARVGKSQNAFGKITLGVYLDDPDDALLSNHNIVFSLCELDKDGGAEKSINISGKLDGVEFKDVKEIILSPDPDHTVELTGLEIGKSYRVSVVGSYWLQPTAKQSDPAGALTEVIDVELVPKEQRDFTAERGSQPVVSMTDIEPWVYAVGAQLNVDDPSATITDDGITVTATDENGEELYKQRYAGAQEFAITPLEPGSKVFISYSYEYEDPATHDKTKVTSDPVFVELLSLEDVQLDEIRASWNEAFAASDSAATFNNIKFCNSTDYEKEPDEFTFENFKKNVLQYLDKVEVEFTPVGTGERVKVTMTSGLVSWAKMEETDESDISMTTKKGLMSSNRRYTYKVSAKDIFGNSIPMKISVNGEKFTEQKVFTGNIYTAKKAPTVRISEVENLIGSMKLHVEVSDTDGSIIDGTALEFCIRDKDGVVQLSGDIAGQVIDETNFGPTSFQLSGSNSYDILVNNLELGFHYTAQVRGSYDPQPDEKPREEGYDLDILENTLLGKKNFIANDGDLALPGAGGEEGTDPEQLEKGTFVGYIEPKVTMGVLEGWVYAVGSDITIYDPTAAIESGVTISVFDDINGTKKSTPNEQGQRVYEGIAENGAVVNEGTGTLVRKNMRDSGEMALGIIKPGSTVYVQYSYSYYETKIKILVDPVTRRKTVDTNERTRKSYRSNITQVKLLKISEGQMASISGSWNTDFAAFADTYSLNSVSFKNSSSYDPNPAKFSFENYKKNTVGYLNDVQMTLKKLDASGQETGSPITVSMTSSVVSKAVSVSGGISFNAAAGLLEPDSVYSYTVKGVDIYGLELPMTMKADDEQTGTPTTTYKGRLYTRKDIPEVTQTVTDNTSGVVTLNIRTNDKWQSLEKDSMVLTIYDSLTMKTPQVLGGTINGEPIPDGTTSLALTGSETNEFTVVLNTLDFYASYGARITGTYDPQPTNAPEGRKVEKESGVKFSEMYFQTAEMASGTVYFGVSTEKVTSSSATVKVAMTSSGRYPTAKGPMGMINRIHITVTKTKGSAVTEFDLIRSELEAMLFESRESRDYEIPSVSSENIKVYVSGAPRTIEAGVVDENLWQAIMGRWNSSDEFVSPLPIKVVLGKDTLVSMSDYSVTVTPYCDRPNSVGREIRNGLSTSNKFTTLKKDPVLVKNELLVAGPSVQLTGAYVLDEDNAINGTFANIMLKDLTTGAIVAADTLPVLKAKPTGTLSEDEYKDLSYTDLLGGHSYLLEVYTTAYDNTVSGSTPIRFSIEAVNFTASADFSGDLNLESLEFDTNAAGRNTLLNLSPEECDRRIKEGGYFTNKYDTGKISLAQDAEGNPITINAGQTIAVTTEMPLPVAAGSYHLIYWYNSKGSQINYQYCYRGGSTWIAPATATHYRIVIPSSCSFAEIGLKLKYTVAKKLAYTDSTDETWKSQRTTHYHSRINATTGRPEENTGDWSSLYMLATEPGASYVFRSYTTANYGDTHTATMFFYNAEQKVVSRRTMNAQDNYIVTVPEGISYISYEWTGFSGSDYGLYRVGEDVPVSVNSYTATLHVKLNDLENYLYALKEKGAGAWLKVEKMDSIRQTERGEQYSEVQQIPIEFVEGGYTFEEDKLLSGLAADTQWRVKLIARCKIGGTAEDPEFTEVTLDTVSFQTDAEYELIHNMNEVKKIYRNPYANYLVVNDFVQNVRAGYNTKLYGVLDFQGHILYRNYTNNDYFLDSTGVGSIIRNMVVEYAETTVDRAVNPIVNSSYGTIDNLVVRTAGEFHHMPYNYYYALVVMYNYGTVRNFILEMNGDFYVERELDTDHSYPNMLFYVNYGTLENWYIYAANNSKLIIGNLPKESESFVEGSLYYTFIRYQFGIVKNGFTKFETKIYTPPYIGTTTFNIFRNEAYSDNMSNYYHVGDYGELDTSGRETTSSTERILYSATAGKTRNFWHLTDVEYTAGPISAVGYAKKANVRNANWQSGVLVDGFDIDTNMKLGYYPRLYFNDCMKQYQPYIPLDTVSNDSAVPTFMDSELLRYTTNPYNPTEQFSAGQIRLYFRNSGYDTINDVVISGLTVLGIQRQGMNDQNLYEVDVNVYIDPDEAAKGAQGYLSNYRLDSIKTQQKGNTPVTIGKTIPNVKFYKTVQGVSDWAAINNHMDWNYRLLNNLTFGSSTLSGTGARIFGSNPNSQKPFKGTLDGNGYTLYGLEIEDGTNANIIYSLEGGTVTNLTVDGLELSLNQYPSQTRIGFIGYAYSAVIDDVHVKNSTLNGFGYAGTIVGYMDAYSRLTNCSGINNYFGDVKTDTETFMGGLVGFSNHSLIASCYVRDSELHPELCTNIHGVGGIVGRAQGTTIQDCYTTGKVTGTGYNVGGIVGNFINDYYCHYESLWSRMTIDIDGDFIGGFAGRSNGSGEGVIALGDIYVDAIHVHRGGGYNNNSNIKARMVGYAGQKVPGLTSLDKDDCYTLATAEDLTNWAYWADKILMDENWNLKSCWVEPTDTTKGYYRSLEYFPMVYKYSEEELEEGQTRQLVKYQEESPIYLPGQGGEYVLDVTVTDYIGTPGSFEVEGQTYSYKERYVAEMTLNHPGVTSEEFIAFYNYCKNGGPDGTWDATKAVNIDGMDMLDASQTVVTLAAITGKPNTTKIIINNFTNDLKDPVYTKALDCYRLNVHYEQSGGDVHVDETLIADVIYKDYLTGEEKYIYWTIPDVGEWRNAIGLKNHGKTKENFLITGEVDFAMGYGALSAKEELENTYRNLQINRLEGTANGKITNLYYTTNVDADPWIASVTTEIKGLSFENCVGDLSQIKTLSSETRTIARVKNRNGVIFAVRDIKECTFDNIRTIVGSKTYGNSAFIMIGYGSVSDTTIRNIYYDTTNLAITGYYNYAAGFMCWIQGGVNRTTVEKIHVVAPKAMYVGGVFSMINGTTWASQSLINEVSVGENGIYGGVVPANEGDPATAADDIPAGDSIVQGFRYTGYLASHIYEAVEKNELGRYSDTLYVKSGSDAGGLAYYSLTYILSTASTIGVRDNKVTNIHVETTLPSGYTGGLFAYIADTVYVPLDGNLADGLDLKAVGGYAGGLYGYGYYRQRIYNNTVINSTLRMETATGKEGAAASPGIGGIIGYSTGYNNIYGCVVRNTTVTGTRNVGGIIGVQSSYEGYVINSCYVAEDVTLTGTNTDFSNVGGIVGWCATCRLAYDACGASINAAGKGAGGLVGYLKQTKDDTPILSQCYFVGSVTGADYVGGVIGYNMNNVEYTVKVNEKTIETRYQTARFLYNGNKTKGSYKDRGYMYGIIVAATLNTTGTAGEDGKPAVLGTHVSPAFNNMMNTDLEEIGGDNPKLYIWDQTVINGVKVDTTKQPFESELITNPASKWLSATQFRERSYYENTTGAGFGSQYFDYSSDLGVLTEYMPFVKYSVTSGQEIIRPYEAYKSYDASGEGIERAGIKLPDYGTNPDALQVYASGVSTVNIEVSEHTDVRREDDWDEDYTPVEYIQSVGGKSYIRTDYDGHDLDLLVDCKFTGVPTVSGYLFGQMQGHGSMLFNGLYRNDRIEYNWKTITFAANTTLEMTQSFTEDGKFNMNINGTNKKADKPTENDSKKNMLIFAWYNTAGNVSYFPNSIKCHYFKLHLGNNAPFMDLYPCIRKSDGKAGMFDKVGKKFYPSMGSEDFVAGPVVTQLDNTGDGLTAQNNAGVTTVYVKFTDENGTETKRTYTTDAHGVVTVDYDFTSGISVSTDDLHYADFTANELRRSVSLTGTYTGLTPDNDIWYYLNTNTAGDRQISYGTVTGTNLVDEYTLPEGYTAVEYVKAEGSQYIKTGVYGPAKVEYKIAFTPYKTTRQLMGWSGSYATYWGIRDATSVLGGKFENGGSVSTTRASLGTADDIIWDFRLNGTSNLYVNGVNVANVSPGSVPMETMELQLLALNGNYLNWASLYECKVWQNDKLVRWFVPAVWHKGQSDEAAGMYDVQGGNFYKSVSKKAFIAGDPITVPQVAKETVVTGTVATEGVGDAIHVWEDRVLLKNGNTYTAYTLTPDVDKASSTATVSLTSPTAVTNGTAHAEAEPFLEETLLVEGTPVPLAVYRNITVQGSTPETETVSNVRMYVEGTMLYQVSPWENLLYDKVILRDRGNKKYIAVLSDEGGLSANFVWDNLRTADIREINNSFTSNDPYIVVLYKSGALRVVNYENGNLLFNTEENAGFLSYVTGVLNSMTGSVSNTQTSGGTSSGSGTETPKAQLDYTVMGGNGLKVTGITAPATGLTLATVGNGTQAGINSVSGTETAAAAEEGADAAGNGQTAGTANNSVSGQAGNGGTAAGNGTVPTDSTNAVAGQSGTETAEKTASEATGTTDGKGQEVPEPKTLTASAVYIPGEGVIDTTGKVIASDEETEYVPGEGVYVGGELVFEESIYAGDEELTEEIAARTLATAKTMQTEETGEESEEEAEEGSTEGTGKAAEETDTGGKSAAKVKETPATVTKAEKSGDVKEPGSTGEAEETEKADKADKEDSAEATEKKRTNGTSTAKGTHKSGENGVAGEKTGGSGGTAADGTAAGGKDSPNAGDAANAGGIGGSSNNGPVLLVTGAEKRRQIANAIGENVTIMNTVTGKAEAYDTEALLDGEVVSAAEKKAREEAAAEKLRQIEKEKESIEIAEAAVPEDAVIAAAGGAFAVTAGLGRTLGEEESSGLMLMGLMVLMAVIALAIIYFAVIRRKRSLLNSRINKRKNETMNNGNSGEEEK